MSAYLQLPVELIDIIEDFLSPTDIACLRQTCCALQNINRAYRCPPVRALSPLHLFSLRRRLDRDSFPVLCQLETSNQLPHKLVACSACLTLHKRKFFEDEQLFETPAQTRVCKASRYVFEVAGQYRVSASTLHWTMEAFAESREELSVDLDSVERPRGLTGTKTWGHKRFDHVFIRPALGATTVMALSSSGLHLRHL